MENRKRPWSPTLNVVPTELEPELSGKERKALDADVRYWKEASKRKDKVITDRDNTIRGLRGHITRLKGALIRRGVYNT